MTAYQTRRSPAATGLRDRTHNTTRAYSTPADAGLLLARLEGVHRAGKGWRACCPAHGSKSASLSIVEGDAGMVLVRCHAGCTAQAIAEAVGLTLADLCPRRDADHRTGSRNAADVALIVASARRRREAEERQRHAEAAGRALALWEGASEASASHPYLRTKRVAPYGIREVGGWLLIPICDTAGALWNVQRIGIGGCKLFERGARIRGLFHLIGTPVADVLCIAEGYATGASVHAATGYPVAVAFNAGNLEPVAINLRASYPTARIVICADNDTATAERIGRNPGMEAATAAARAVGGLLAVPHFGMEAAA
ncbi:MAG: toprim domain-containing protein [Rhodanobacter sp.]|nr:MAG: toprim domain-containing protein [Rhodanobacter sp.]TAM14624.1 MAG: toprim domain-containing protein [Rhodanobacter sp.]TAM37416.1 MAG: toprim domain-containing protein [Rhodanobacter sp.]